MSVDRVNWHAVMEHYVRAVNEGKATPAEAIRDMELSLLGDMDITKRNLFVELGDLALGAWRDAWNWLSDLARYRYVRFFGISWGRVYFGLLVGSTMPPTEAKRRERIEQLTNEGDTP